MLSARSSRRAAALLAALVGWTFLAGPAPAADPAAPDTSLKLVPADAAFYSSMLRNKEQLDLVANSRAWAKLWAMPSVQQAWKVVQDQYNTPTGSLSTFRQLMQTEENQELVALIGDAFSDEVFCYGDDGWADLFDLYQEAYAGMQYQPLLDQLHHQAGDGPSQGNPIRPILSALAKNPDKIKVPNFVVGFKVSDAQRAEKQIRRLEQFAQQLGAQFPDFKERVKRTKIGDASFLTLTLEGSQIPWDQFSWKQLEDKPGEFAPVIDRLKSLTLTISLGVDHGYLIVGIGPSTEYLSTFAGHGPRLDGRPEFKPLAKFADRKLTSIGYSSKEYLRRVASSATRQLDAVIGLAQSGLDKADLTADERKAVLKHLTDLRTAMQAEQANVGAEMSFSFLSERGYEGYSYNYGKHDDPGVSKPLTLLDHLGGAPLIAAVGRAKVSVEDYERMVQAIQEAFPDLDKIAEDKLTGQNKERYEKAKEDFLPLLKRMSETTDKLLLPALADGQFGFVLDAKWTSKQWVKAMPETETAMPMPELGIVLGVSDAEALRKAMSEYREIANDALTKIKAWPDGDKIVGDFQVPPPETKKTKAGTLYWYSLPESWGVDPQVAPTAGLSDDVAVLTLSHSHAERLLASHPLKLDGGPLDDPKQALTGAAIIDWAGIVDAATPWVVYGTGKILEAQAGGPVPARNQEAVLDQVRTVLDVLKCFRGVTSATYLEDGVQVTHYETVFRDLEK